MGEQKYIVYLHINKVNNKVYVGITRQKPELRWRKGKGYKDNIYFTKAIEKYGWDNFKHVIVFKNIPKDLACREEILLIKRYRKQGICYNIANGGEGSQAFPEEAKEKLRKYVGPLASQYGKKHSLERVAQQSKIAKKLWEDQREHRLHILLTRMVKRGPENWMYGRKLPESHKQKLKEVTQKQVSYYNLFGKYLGTFNSIGEAASSLKIDDGHIGQCCTGKRRTAGNYMWRFGNSREDLPPIRDIIVLIEDNKIVKEFICISDAAKYVGKHYTCVSDILKGKVKNPYSKLIFKYKKDVI